MLAYILLPLLGIGLLATLFDNDDDDPVIEPPIEPENEIDGTEGPDLLTGTGANDVVNGRGGDDELRGFGGDDTLPNNMVLPPTVICRSRFRGVSVNCDGAFAIISMINSRPIRTTSPSIRAPASRKSPSASGLSMAIPISSRISIAPR